MAVASPPASALTSTESSPSPVERLLFSTAVERDDACAVIETLSSPFPVSMVESTAPWAIPVSRSHEYSLSVQVPDAE